MLPVLERTGELDFEDIVEERIHGLGERLGNGRRWLEEPGSEEQDGESEEGSEHGETSATNRSAGSGER